MKKISIIIPHYNSPYLLEKLLHSIPENKDIETIVVDDKSDKLLEEYKKLRRKMEYRNIIFLENTSNKKGAGVCRNIGLNIAKGEWVLFADSDDYFLKDFYKNIHHLLESNSDIIFFKPISIELDTGNVSDRHLEFEKLVLDYKNDQNNQTELKIRYRFVVPWSKMIRRSMIDNNNIKFSETIVANDVIFSTQIGYWANRIEVSDISIYCVTRERGSLTTNVSAEKLNIRLDIFIENYNFIKQVLTKQEFKSLNLRGTAFLIDAILYKTGIKNILYTYVKLKKNKIAVIRTYIFNPLMIIKKLISRYKGYKKISKYLIR